MISENATLQFHALRYINIPEKQNLYKLNLVRKDLASSINVDDRAIQILKLLQNNKTIKQAAKEVDFSIPVVMTIVKMFAQNNFVKSINGLPYDKNDFTPESHIEFHHLKWADKPDEHQLYGIVRWDTDVSLRVDGKVIEIIKMLQAGKNIKSVAKEIGYSIDVVSTVLRMLEEAHFFKSIDGITLDDTDPKVKPLWPNLHPLMFKILYSNASAIFFGIFSLVGISYGVFKHGIPTYKSLFWTEDLFTVFISIFVMSIIVTFLHEFFGHYLATRAAGGQAYMRLNYRYLSLVGETESYHLALVKKRSRYIVYLSGIFVDIIIIAISYWMLVLMPLLSLHNEFLIDFLPVIILAELLGIIWQFDAFLETDMYNFLTEVTGIENLRFDALKYIDLHTKRLNRILLFPIKQLLLLFSKDYKTDSDDLRQLSKNDKRKLLFYIFMLIAGLGFLTFQTFYYAIPRDVTFIYDSVIDINKALLANDLLTVIKSLIIIIYILYEYLLVLYFKIRGNKEK